MGYLKRAGGRIIVAFVVVGVISLGVWIFDQFDGNTDSGGMKAGECFIMTDGPTRGSGGEEELILRDTMAEDEYPSVDCDAWNEQESPWLVYRVEWVKSPGGDNGTTTDLEKSCEDITITTGQQSVTCLANMEFINS